METRSRAGWTAVGAGLTSMVALFFLPLKVATVTVAVPLFTAVNRPSGVTVAASPAQEKITLPTLPLESL